MEGKPPPPLIKSASYAPGYISESHEHLVIDTNQLGSSSNAGAHQHNHGRRSLDRSNVYHPHVGPTPLGGSGQKINNDNNNNNEKEKGNKKKSSLEQNISLEINPTPPVLRSNSLQVDFNENPRLNANLLSAETTLLLDFNYENPNRSNHHYFDQLLKRKIICPTTGRNEIQIWNLSSTVPKEVGELSKRFRNRLGWLETNEWKRLKKTSFLWRNITLKMSPEAKKLLFPNNCIQIYAIGENQEKRRCEVGVEEIKLVLGPLATGLLLFKFNWLSHKEHKQHDQEKEEEEEEEEEGRVAGEKEVYSRVFVKTLSDLRIWVYLLKFRYEIDNVLRGWTIPQKADTDHHDHHHSTLTFFEEFRKQIGSLSLATYERNPQSLGEIGNWLVALPSDHGHPQVVLGSLPLRIHSGTRVYHHTSIIVDDNLATKNYDIFRSYLFHFRRALGMMNRPIEENSKKEDGRERVHGPDKVIVQRDNEYISIGSDGACLVSWPFQSSASVHHSTDEGLFQGIYLELDIQAQIERSVLFTLFNLSSEMAVDLGTEQSKGGSWEGIESYRRGLRSLATKMIKYTVSMSNDDCGGRPDFANYYHSMRKVMKIHEGTKEVREIIDDVLGIAEAVYTEERKSLKDREWKLELVKRREKKETTERKEKKRKVYDVLTSVSAAAILPFLFAGAVWGMNLKDLPDPGFTPIILWSSCMSVILLFALLYYLFVYNK